VKTGYGSGAFVVVRANKLPSPVTNASNE